MDTLVTAVDTLVSAVAVLSAAWTTACNWDPLTASVDVADTVPAAKLVNVRFLVAEPMETVPPAVPPANV